MTSQGQAENARALWQERLDFYLAEEAKAADPAQRFQLHKAIQEARIRLAELDATDPPRLKDAVPRIDLTHLPAGAEHFLGRGPELAALDAAWSQSGTAVVELIAPGGTGKTALAKRWLDRLRAQGWGGAVRVYGCSGYDRQIATTQAT